MEEALLEFLFQRLKSLLIRQESEKFSGLKDQILLLMTKLLDLKSQIQLFNSRLLELGYFTEDHATSSTELKKSIQNWWSKVRETIYDADDCIDRFIIVHTDGIDQSASAAVLESELRMINELCLTDILNSKYHLDTSIEHREVVSTKSSSHVVVDDEGENSLASFALKFSTLPFYLKSCFIYCCNFPEKQSIGKEKLIRLLMAEGLVQEIPGERMEDTAEKNINKLLELEMLQEKHHWIDYTVPWPFRPFPERDENLFIGDASSDTSIPLNIRRLWIEVNHDIISSKLRNIHISPIRSLFVYTCGIGPCSLSNCLETIFYRLKLLRVLDISGVTCGNLPEEVGNMIHLRYLGLNCSELKELPESLGSLRNLQTLIIGGHSRNAEPRGILNLVQLRHLEIHNRGEIFTVPKGIGRLTNLQTLTGLYAGGGDIASELSNLTQLRKLGVVYLSELRATDELYASITKMTGLLSLSLAAEDISHCVGFDVNDRLLPSLEPFSPPPLLRELRLVGCLQEMPDWFNSMENLIELELTNSDLSETPTSVLQFLPNLKILKLYDAYKATRIGRELCASGGFPSLHVLTIDSRILIEWTELEEGALPSLKELCFYNCKSLRTLPEGLQRVTTLQTLKVYPIHGDLARKLSPEGGKENYKIKHIPDVRLDDF